MLDLLEYVDGGDIVVYYLNLTSLFQVIMSVKLVINKIKIKFIRWKYWVS